MATIHTILATSSFAKSRIGKAPIQAVVVDGPRSDVPCMVGGPAIFLEFANGYCRWIPEHGDRHFTITATRTTP